MSIKKAIDYFDGDGSPYDDLAIKSLERQMPKGLVKEKSKGDFEDCILYKCQICGGESEEICEGIKLKRPYWCNYCPYYKK